MKTYAATYDVEGALFTLRVHADDEDDGARKLASIYTDPVILGPPRDGLVPFGWMTKPFGSDPTDAEMIGVAWCRDHDEAKRHGVAILHHGRIDGELHHELDGSTAVDTVVAIVDALNSDEDPS